jgi:protein phosphatase
VVTSISATNRPASERTTIILPPEGHAEPVEVRLECGAQTHVGKVRSNNEDQFLIVRLRKALDVLLTSLPGEQCARLFERTGSVLLVADGMGGHAAGEHASAVVVTETVNHFLETAKWFFKLDDPDEQVRLRLLREGLERVDRQLIEEAEHNPALEGMGTTLTGATVIGAEAFIVHVGDSRAYLYRNGHLEQLTKDHTLVQEMVDRGLLRPEEAKTHRLRHMLSNVIGGMRGVAGEVVKLRLADGDRLLLCTDGLTEPVEDDEIAAILAKYPNPEEACNALIQAALRHGGPDNVTVVLAVCSIQG